MLAAQDESRVPQLVPIRYGRMLASPFSFFRGAAAVMAADLGGRPSPRLEAQLCGDAHLSNFGVFEAPDRRLVFDVNDFDETLRGPFEWDVKRLAASLAVAGREQAFAEAERRAATLAAVREYREAMRGFADMGDLEVWYSRLDVAAFLDRVRPSVKKRRLKELKKGMAKARNKDSKRALSRLSERVDGRLRIVSDPPLIVPIEQMIQGEERIESILRALLSAYRKTLLVDRRMIAARYSYAHAAHKVVGVGSVGSRACSRRCRGWAGWSPGGPSTRTGPATAGRPSCAG